MLKKLLKFMAAATVLTFVATLALLPFAVRSGVRYANELATYFVYETLVDEQPAEGISKVVVDTGDSFAYLQVYTVPENRISLRMQGLQSANITPTLTVEGDTLYLDIDIAVREEFAEIEEMVKKGAHAELELYLPAGVELEYDDGNAYFYADRMGAYDGSRTRLLGDGFGGYLSVSPASLETLYGPLEQFAAGNLTEAELITRLDAYHYDVLSTLRTEVNARAEQGLHDWRESSPALYYDGAEEPPEELASSAAAGQAEIDFGAADHGVADHGQATTARASEQAEEQVWAQVDAACTAAERYLNARRDYVVAATKAWCKQHMADESMNGRMADPAPGSTAELLRTEKNRAEQALLEARRALDKALRGGEIANFPEDGGFALRSVFYDCLNIRNPYVGEQGYDSRSFGY